MTARYRTGACACCGTEGPIGGRGLMPRCYDRISRSGNLTDYPRVTRSAADFIADYRMLRGEGHTHRQIAERLEYPLPTMRRQICRLRRRGLLTPAGGAW